MNDATPAVAPRKPVGVDRAVAGLAIALALLMAVRPPFPGESDLIPTTAGFDMAFLVIGGVLAAVLWRLRRIRATSGRWLTRVVGYGFVAVFGLMVQTRAKIYLHESRSIELWPPRLETTRLFGSDSLEPLEAAEWGLRVALHAVPTDVRSLTAPPLIPAGWPFPPNVELAIVATGGGSPELWARDARSGAACHAAALTLGTADYVALAPSCDTVDAIIPRGVFFAKPRRGVEQAADPSLDSAVSGWRQHRVDAARSGATNPPIPGTATPRVAWRSSTPTQVRASVSVVGAFVLEGGHGTGLITAIRLADGAVQWTTRVPNWIHQEPVSDGRTVVVGFGDNGRSFLNRAPSGVAAYELATGRRLWTRFDESSVMTSPSISGSTVVYGTAAGVIRQRSLRTGAELATTTVPGGVIMGPPALRHDTLVTALDVDAVCALALGSLRTLWCHRLHGQRMVGHAGPAIAGGLVIVSGVGSPVTPGFLDFVRLPVRLQATLVRMTLFPEYWDDTRSGQVFSALDLATGEKRWASPFYASRRIVDGHSAGTAVIAGNVGVIVLPMADTLVTFDVATGKVRWTAGAHAARGPASVVGNHVILAGRDGVIEVRRLADGVLTCAIRRPVGWDRAGPAVAGGAALFADLDGRVESIPIRDLLLCRPS